MKTALQQVSDQYEQVKREYYVCLDNSPAKPVLGEAVRVWAHALMILQSCRGNLVG